MRKWITLIIALMAVPIAAQIPSGFVQTTATVSALANGHFSAAWTNQSSSSQLPLLGGLSTFPITATGSFDASGKMSVLLADTSQIVPSPSTWTFTFTFYCPTTYTPPPAFTVQVAVTGGGSSEDISSNISAVLPPNPCVSSGGGGGGSQPTNGLVSGGGVVWTGGLSFTVSAASYYIGGNLYNSPQTSVTLATADPSNPRIDEIYVDNTGAVGVLTGTPTSNPATPTPNPSSQLGIDSVLVPAGATTPGGVTTTNIYLENAEWTCAPSANPPVNCASTTLPYQGTLDISFTNATPNLLGPNVTLTKPSSGTEDLSTQSTLSFYILNKTANWSSGTSLQIYWLNGTGVVGSTVSLKNGVYGFSTANTTSYQQIVIPTSAFGTGSNLVTTLKATVYGSGTAVTFYLDNIILQSGTSGGGSGSGVASISATSPIQVNGGAGPTSGTVTVSCPTCSTGSGTVSSGAYLHIPYYTVNPTGTTLGADSVATTDGAGNFSFRTVTTSISTSGSPSLTANNTGTSTNFNLAGAMLCPNVPSDPTNGACTLAVGSSDALGDGLTANFGWLNRGSSSANRGYLGTGTSTTEHYAFEWDLAGNTYLPQLPGQSVLGTDVAGKIIPGTVTSGFPITLGSTSIAAGSTTTAVTGLSVNGVTLNGAGSTSLFLNQAGGYSTPSGTGGTPAGLTGAGQYNASGSFGGTNVVYLAPPVQPPATITATPSTTGGTLAAGTYYVIATATNGTGQTIGSPEASATTTGTTGSIALTWTAITGATGYRVYVGTSSGGEGQYFTTATASFTVTTATGTAGTVPAQNTTVDMGTEINSAETALLANPYGGVIHLPPGSSNIATAATISDRRISLQGYGREGSKLTCTLAGNCLTVHPDYFQATGADKFAAGGYVGDFSFSGNAAANQVLLLTEDSIGWQYNQIYFDNASASTDVCMEMDNLNYWTEFNQINISTGYNCYVGLKLYGTATGNNSFGYNQINMEMFPNSSGYTGLMLSHQAGAAGLLLYGGTLTIGGSVAGTAVSIDSDWSVSTLNSEPEWLAANLEGAGTMWNVASGNVFFWGYADYSLSQGTAYSNGFYVAGVARNTQAVNTSYLASTPAQTNNNNAASFPQSAGNFCPNVTDQCTSYFGKDKSTNGDAVQIGWVASPQRGALGLINAASPFWNLEWDSSGNVYLPYITSSSGIYTDSSGTIKASPSGTVPLVAGTATVSNSAACAAGSSCIYTLTHCAAGGTMGILSVGTVTAGTSFVINSTSNTDTSTVCWKIN